MTLFNKSATAGLGPAFDVQPAQPLNFLATIFAPFSFIKNAGQGACAGLLSFLGAMHLTDGITPDGAGLAVLTNIDASTFESLAENLLSGSLPGAIEIIGAAVLFLNAGRGWAKTLGLLGFIAIAFAHANDASHAEVFEQMTDLYETVQATIVKFQTVQANALSR